MLAGAVEREWVRYGKVNGGLIMSIAGYFSRPGAERVTKGEQIRELLAEKKPVEKKEQKIQVYETMRDYDPVLRSHCRMRVEEVE